MGAPVAPGLRQLPKSGRRCIPAKSHDYAGLLSLGGVGRPRESHAHPLSSGLATFQRHTTAVSCSQPKML